MNELAGKVILITGAGRGAGRTLARTFAALGATIAANDISPLNVDTVVAEILATGGTARAYVHDVAKKIAAQTMLNQVLNDYGRIDALFNCANVRPPASLLDIDEWDLHRAFEVNAIGTFLMTQSVGRVMRDMGGGIIINVTRLPKDAPASYLASRAGIPILSKRADDELKAYGVRVFSITEKNLTKSALRLLQTAWMPKPSLDSTAKTFSKH